MHDGTRFALLTVSGVRHMNRKSIMVVLGVVGVFSAAVGVLWIIDKHEVISRVNPVVSDTATAPAQPKEKETPKPQPIPAYQGEASIATLGPTLSPEMFSGQAKAAYMIAREIPDTLAQLPCYCHCDKSIRHKSLHSCFTDDHAANCGICMNEAMAAYKYKKEKHLTAAQIREKIIAEFGRGG